MCSMVLNAELTTWTGNITEILLRGGPGVSLLALVTPKNLSGDKMKAHKHHFYSREEKHKSTAWSYSFLDIISPMDCKST